MTFEEIVKALKDRAEAQAQEIRDELGNQDLYKFGLCEKGIQTPEKVCEVDMVWRMMHEMKTKDKP